MRFLLPLGFALLSVLVLLAGSALLARLLAHQAACDQAQALDRPEARVALQKSWPLK